MDTDRSKLTAEWMNGLMTLVLAQPDDEVRAGAPRGERAADDFIASAVEKATSSTLMRASELLRVVRDSEAKEKELAARLKELDREKRTATAVAFGAALTARLTELDREVGTTTGRLNSTLSDRQVALRELEKIRDTATEDGPVAVRRAVRDRLRAARIERERAAESLLAALAPHLAAVLALDSEIDVLDGVRALSAIKKALVAVLPEAFGPAGPVRLERYDHTANRPEPEPVTDPRQVKYLPGWRRPGYESEYGIEDHDRRWEGV